MASYFSSLKLPNVSTSNLGSSLSERFQTVRKALTNSSETDDPDDPELSHISNVLRAYYIEKGRPLPPWLPPDPKAPPPPVIPQQPAYGSGYGYGQMNPYDNSAPTQRSTAGGARGGGLSDLWDSAPAAPAPPPSQSLRAARTAGPRPSHVPSSSISSSGGPPSPERQVGAARPLPSQKAGSYQTAINQSGAFNRGGSTGSTGSTSSAQERLRARLQGGGRESPTPPGSSASGGYGTSAYGGGGGGTGQPYMSSSRPWDSGGASESFDSGYGSAGVRRPPGGLPGNPRLGGGPRGPR